MFTPLRFCRNGTLFVAGAEFRPRGGGVGWGGGGPQSRQAYRAGGKQRRFILWAFIDTAAGRPNATVAERHHRHKVPSPHPMAKHAPFVPHLRNSRCRSCRPPTEGFFLRVHRSRLAKSLFGTVEPSAKAPCARLRYDRSERRLALCSTELYNSIRWIVRRPLKFSTPFRPARRIAQFSASSK